MNRLQAGTTGLVLAALVATGCAPAAPQHDTAADVAAIEQLAAREIAAFSSGDMSALPSVFTTDALTMAPDEPTLQGRDALVAWAQAMGEQFVLKGEYLTNDVVVSGDLAVHHYTGRMTLTPKAGGDTMTQSVKGVHVLKRQADGSWLISQDVWNSDAPPPPMPMAGK